MFLPTSTVGRKIVMAVTGQFMLLYVVAHVLGNSTIFFYGINAYAAALRRWPFLIVLWSSRALLFLSMVLHSYIGVVLKLENRKAKPESSVVTQYRKAGFAGRFQIWTGVVIGAFLLYHLLQFTFQVTNPSVAADTHPDQLGRPDVFAMVVGSFRNITIAAVYLLGLAALGLHVLHGIQSSFQSWGLNNDRSLPVMEQAGAVASIILFLGYTTIPIAIIIGILK